MVDWVTAIVKIGSNAFAPKNKCVLDNICFKLYYKVTTSILMAAVILLTGSLWVGKPISCIVSDQNAKEMFENHCLMTGTTTIYTTTDEAENKFGRWRLYPGILPTGDWSKGVEEQRHPWYKWTALLLFLLAGAFYIPHWLWKVAEGGRLNALRQDLGGKKILSVADRDQQRKLAVECLMESRGKSNRVYCLTFFGLEVANIAIAFAVMYLLNVVFQNQYLEYGTDNIKLLLLKTEYARYDPMEKLFPKVAKCSLNTFGPSGTITNMEGLCFLYHNYLNEFVFLFLWFWLVFIVALNLVYLASTRVLSAFKWFRAGVLHNKCSAMKASEIQLITNNLGFCDWYILNTLLSQITPAIAHAVLLDVAAELKKTRAKDNVP